jgi:acyl-CoA oxidase
MIFIRAELAQGAAAALAKAVTIAVRYAYARRQFAIAPAPHPDAAGPAHAEGDGLSVAWTGSLPVPPHPSPPPGAPPAPSAELPVLMYPLVARRLLPLISEALALRFAGRRLQAQYADFQKHLADVLASPGTQTLDADRLADLHALAAGMKAIGTGLAADGIEVCRRACGGHGYSALSGLPELYGSYVGTVTAEGDNFLLLLQTARYLLKSAQQVAAGESRVASSAAYLSRLADVESGRWRFPMGAAGPGAAASTDEDVARGAWLSCAMPASSAAAFPALDALQFRAAWLTRRAAGVVARALAEGASPAAAFVAAEWESFEAAVAHCTAYTAESFAVGVASARTSGALGAAGESAMRLCVVAFAMRHVETGLGDLVTGGYLDAHQASAARRVVPILLRRIRPLAASLTDLFDFSDAQLCSALGRRDGRVYEALLAGARRDPLNHVPPFNPFAARPPGAAAGAPSPDGNSLAERPGGAAPPPAHTAAGSSALMDWLQHQWRVRLEGSTRSRL